MPPRRSAASSRSTARSTPRSPSFLAETFLECVVAPSYSAAARECSPLGETCGWSRRTACGSRRPTTWRGRCARSPAGRWSRASITAWSISPPPRSRASGRPARPSAPILAFAWRVAKHVKSNAIVFAKDGVTLAVGAGQMSASSRCGSASARPATSWSARPSRPTRSFRSAMGSTCCGGRRGRRGPARRFGARRRGDLGRQRAQARDVVHWHAPLPALNIAR